MIVKTITCHDVYNSGASLQAFALQKYITDLGHDVEIIDYKPNYLSNHFHLFGISNPRYEKNIFTKLFYLSIKLPYRILSLLKKVRFDNFAQKHLTITDKRYRSNVELCFTPPLADVYIAGSDQIWNTLFKNGSDASFYLNFAPKSAKRISYAASFAGPSIAPEHYDFVKKELNNFDDIAVRESDGLNLLKELGYTSAKWVCDPVFLLSHDDWIKLAKKTYTEDYLLIYDFEFNREIKSLAQKIASDNQWKIYVVNSTFNYADKNFPYAGPIEFLSLIKHAKFVISNSFHATAFSLIFQKEFLVIKREEAINSRMESLLNYLNLNHKIILNKDAYDAKAINYSEIAEKLNFQISQSKQYLNQHLTQI